MLEYLSITWNPDWIRECQSNPNNQDNKMKGNNKEQGKKELPKESIGDPMGRKHKKRIRVMGTKMVTNVNLGQCSMEKRMLPVRSTIIKNISMTLQDEENVRKL